MSISELKSMPVEEKYLPGLILYFSAIDILAFLSKPVKQNEVKRTDFIGWSDQYIIPILDADLGLTAMDLYGARCGIIHSYSPESGLQKKGEAKELSYTDNRMLYQALNAKFGSGDSKMKIVNFRNLLLSLRNGYSTFRLEIDNDNELQQRIDLNAERQFEIYKN